MAGDKVVNFVEYPDRDLMVIGLAQQLTADLTEALDSRERVLFVVPGGETPGPVFDQLCAADIDWSRVDVVLSDERWVPESDPRSNTRLVRERLLAERAAAARFLPLHSETRSLEECLPEFEKNLEPNLPVSVCVLGMGGDMHTASMFSGADNLFLALSPAAPILVPMRGESMPEDRITLSARVLNDTIAKHIIITGEAKKGAIERAQRLEPEDAPIRAVLPGAKVHWAP